MEPLENQDMLLRRAAESLFAKKLLESVSGQPGRVDPMADGIKTENELLARTQPVVRQTKDGTPTNLFLVLTFGVASCLDRGLFESRGEAENTMCEIRQRGGDPKLYQCILCSPNDKLSCLENAPSEFHTTPKWTAFSRSA